MPSPVLCCSLARDGYTDIDSRIADTDPRRKVKSLFPYAVAAACLVLIVSARVLASGSSATSFLRTADPASAVPFACMPHPTEPSAIWSNVKKPYPTGAFWTNLVVGQGDGAVGVHPYGVKCLPAGVQVSYGAARRTLQPLSITDHFTTDIQISAAEQYLGRGVSSYDNASVTMEYSVEGGAYSTPLVKGSPFVTAIFRNCTPSITSNLMIISSAEPMALPKGIEGSLVIVTLGNFLKWLVYCSGDDPLRLEGAPPARVLTTGGPLSGVVRVALVPLGNEEASISTLVKSLRTYPVGVDIKLGITGAAASVEYAFRSASIPAESHDSLLMLALPHHLSIIDRHAAAAVLNLSSYGPCFDIKGVLQAVIGSTWSLKYDLVSVGWTFNTEEASFPTSELNAIAAALSAELEGSQPESAADPYGFGKEASRMANLALVADFLGIADARQNAIQKLNSMLQPWITVTNTDYLVYDETYGGVVTTQGLQSSQADFGNGWYNDHHFHYGYLIYSGAVLAHLLPGAWKGATKDFFDTLVRDVCNSNNEDPLFPFARHKDLFDGHSWASGLFQQANGKSQESSSEAVNAYYGCYLYGMATGNQHLTSFSQILLTMEIQAAKMYWHMPDATIYDPQFAANRMAGVVGSLSVTASTWFGDMPEYVHGINMMPVTAVTPQLFDASFAAKQWPILLKRVATLSKYIPSCSANPGCSSLGIDGDCCPSSGGLNLACCSDGGSNTMSGEFEALIYADQALVDKSLAWKELSSLKNSAGIGASSANYLLWTASRSVTKWNNMTATEMQIFDNTEADSTSIRADCSANSACRALGIMTGFCCPTKSGQMLGCCPQPG